MLEALVGTLPAKAQPYAKTYTAVLVTILIVVSTSTDAPKWLTIVLAILTSPLVFAMPNLDPKGKKQDESTQPPTDLPAGGYIPGTVNSLVNDALSQPYKED